MKRFHTHAPMKLIVYRPKTPKGSRELEERLTGLYAEWIESQVQSLPCPEERKRELLRAVARNVQEPKDRKT